MREEMLVIEKGKITKAENDIIKELYLQIYKAEIFGIIFYNILERNCLLDFFKGNKNLGSGKIYLNNEKIDINDSPRYFVPTIAIIDRTSKLINSLNIVTNVMLFASSVQKYITSNKKYVCAMEEIKKKLQVDIKIDKPVSTLSSKERVIIELIKAYAERKRLIVLTDITGFLKSTELMEIFSLINRLRELGMTFAIIESVEDIVFEYTDRLAIIRNGKTLGIYKSEDFKRRRIYSVLFGNRSKCLIKKSPSIKESEPRISQPALRLVNINTEILKDFNFLINKGEIIKVYYTDDSSCNDIIELLKGIRKPLSGQIIVSNNEYRVNNTHQAVDKGVCFIEESPYENMIFSNMSILDNLCLSLAKKVPDLWIKSQYTKSVQKLVSHFINEDITKVRLSRLSHVKLQQIAYLKWLLYAPAVVVCIKPFTEIDIQLREITIDMIDMLTQRGIAVIIFTSNISETYWVEGDTVCIRNGQIINEDKAYQPLL
jgi:ABC-type sugar transport system, ATPase component